MKKICLYLLFLLLCVSCTRLAGEAGPEGEKQIQQNKYVIKTINDCEYIEVDFGYGDSRVYSLTHKGNCANCSRSRTLQIALLNLQIALLGEIKYLKRYEPHQNLHKRVSKKKLPG